MATKFVKAAAKQLDPVYGQQEAAIASQVPAIQNLYNTLIQGLEQSSAQQLETGVQGITEDASRRGVLRSTLPVDARQALQAGLSQALLQGRAQLESQRMGDVAGINEKLGGLRIQRTGNIADLARALETRDLERRQFEYQRKAGNRDYKLQKLQANRDYQLQQQQLAIARSRGSGTGSTTRKTAAQVLAENASQTRKNLESQWGADKKVSPETWERALSEWLDQGYTTDSFVNRFGKYVNTSHRDDYVGY